MMLLLSVCSGFAFSLFATSVALPTDRILAPSTRNGESSLSQKPATKYECWASHVKTRLNPIEKLFDCIIAILSIANDGALTNDIHWTSEQSWTYQSCSLYLTPRLGIPNSSAMFSRSSIIHEALILQSACVTRQYLSAGGSASIGQGVFQLSLVAAAQPSQQKDRKRAIADSQAELGKRALPPQIPSQPSLSQNITTPTNASLTTLSAFVPPQCWPNYPPPRGHEPITSPRDCHAAKSKILAEGSVAIPISWTSWHTWIDGSCSIRLLPAVVSSRDSFTRLDIVRAANRVQTSCVNEANGFRGGVLGVGKGKMFDVIVEAAGQSPLYGGGGTGVGSI